MRTEEWLRAVAWERAKGEMRSIIALQAHEDGGERFDQVERHFENFIKETESEGLHE